MFTFGADGNAVRRAGCWGVRRGPVGGVRWWRAVEWVGLARGVARLAARAGWAVLGGEGGGLGRRVGGGREVFERVAATFALFGREPVGGAVFVLGLAGVEAC